MTEQQEHKTVRMSEITPEILENINVGDWIEGIGDVSCFFDQKVIRTVGIWLSSHLHNPAPPARYIDEESETPCTREGIDLILISAERARSNPRNPVPSSTELITMANLEWRNREERRGIHNREDWCCGWMAGFLTEKKPNWAKEQIEAAERRGYERAQDEHGILHGEDARKFNEELENPSPMTPEAAEVMRKARRELARK